TAVTGSRLVYREPGYALLDGGELVTGRRAMAQARRHPRSVVNHYWRHLGVEPVQELKFRHLSPADLASRQLEELWRGERCAADGVVFAVPAWMERDSLGVLLGIAGELALPVTALVDSAVACSRRAYPGRSLLHIDLSLHTATVSRIAQDDGAVSDRVELVDAAGLVALRDTWVAVIAEAFVRQSRFDPLHTAESEQLLHDRLDAWLETAGRSGEVRMQLEVGGHVHEATLPLITFTEAVSGIYQSLAGHVRSLIRAAEVPALQLTRHTAGLPGLVDFLVARAGGEPFVLEEAAAARGALARASAATAGAKRLTRRLPWDQSPVEAPAAPAREPGESPTHLLDGHRARALDEAGLAIGTSLGGEPGITLDADMAGVSRRHCVLRRENGQSIVEDLSRYGTWLNGSRIDGSAVLQAGDSLRVGTPGQEFRLIRVVENDDA
ncbi:MAG TPA: FHA domain-containing protein, partial [Woeseiaceae bacterium]|nr:FHA domain-containing protein [Woeseiaceae bacterium]